MTLASLKVEDNLDSRFVCTMVTGLLRNFLLSGMVMNVFEVTWEPTC